MLMHGREKRHSSSPDLPDRLLGPPTLLRKHEADHSITVEVMFYYMYFPDVSTKFLRAIMPTYFTFLDLISLVIFSERYKIRTSSYCNILYPPLTNYLIVSNILLNILFSESAL